MAYVGRGLTTGAQYQKLDTITVNNVDYFTMNVNSTAVTPAPEHLILAVNGVIQEPNVGFTLSGSTCTLASAIDNDGGSDTIWGMIAGDAAYAAVTALNNATANELVTVGSTTTELDAEANLTYDGTTFIAYDKFAIGSKKQFNEVGYGTGEGWTNDSWHTMASTSGAGHWFVFTHGRNGIHQFAGVFYACDDGGGSRDKAAWFSEISSGHRWNGADIEVKQDTGGTVVVDWVCYQLNKE